MYEQEKWERRQAAARRLGLTGAAEVELVAIAALVRKTAPVSKRRRERLRAHLSSLVADLAAPAQIEPPAKEQAPLGVETVCRACRGSCCRHGGDHAYLRRPQLEQLIGREPGRGPDHAVSSYMALVPARTYHGSCIFHSVDGCALPREMRSRTCRDFYCDGLREAHAAATGGAAGFALVVLTGDDGRRRQVLLRRSNDDGAPGLVAKLPSAPPSLRRR